jgi:hypothetical protein
MSVDDITWNRLEANERLSINTIVQGIKEKIEEMKRRGNRKAVVTILNTASDINSDSITSLIRPKVKILYNAADALGQTLLSLQIEEGVKFKVIFLDDFTGQNEFSAKKLTQKRIPTKSLNGGLQHRDNNIDQVTSTLKEEINSALIPEMPSGDGTDDPKVIVICFIDYDLGINPNIANGLNVAESIINEFDPAKES